jgi:hypothetical protein
MTWKTFAAAVAVAALALTAAGCGGGDGQLTGARVKGHVKYKGKVLTGGEIQFVDPKDANKSQSGRINGDGTFDVPNVPVGEVVVLIDTEMAKYDVSSFTPPKGAGGGGANENPYLKDAPKPTTPPMKHMVIDKKYAKADTSPLKMSVQKGTNDKDFELD